jgi:hypothetical protein
LIELFKFQDKKLTDKITQKPGVPLPDVDAMNDAIKDEWEPDPFTSEPRGPWVQWYTVQCVNPATGSALTVSNGTKGQQKAWEDLKSRISLTRKIERDPLLYPEIMLGSKMWKTGYGMRLRPEFEIVGWKSFGPPTAPAIQAPSAPIASITAVEIINDTIPEHPAPKMEPAKKVDLYAKYGAGAKGVEMNEAANPKPRVRNPEPDWVPWDDPMPANLKD